MVKIQYLNLLGLAKSLVRLIFRDFRSFLGIIFLWLTLVKFCRTVKTRRSLWESSDDFWSIHAKPADICGSRPSCILRRGKRMASNLSVSSHGRSCSHWSRKVFHTPCIHMVESRCVFSCEPLPSKNITIIILTIRFPRSLKG